MVTIGCVSDIVALCLDREDGADDTLLELERQYGILPPTIEMVRSDGYAFLLFRYPYCPVPHMTLLGRGLSLCSDGDRILLRPRYRLRNSRTWQKLSSIDFAFLPEMPNWLLSRATTVGKVGGGGRGRGRGEGTVIHVVILWTQNAVVRVDRLDIEIALAEA